MIFAERMEVLRKWEQAINDSNGVIDPIMDLFNIDGPLINTLSNLQSTMTEIASAALGDEEGWLAWYWLENDMGKKAMVAGYSNSHKKIKTIEDLMELIS